MARRDYIQPIALAFIGQMSRLGTAFRAFALILLPGLAAPDGVDRAAIFVPAAQTAERP